MYCRMEISAAGLSKVDIRHEYFFATFVFRFFSVDYHFVGYLTSGSFILVGKWGNIFHRTLLLLLLMTVIIIIIHTTCCTRC